MPDNRGRSDRRGMHLPKTARHPMIVVHPTPELQKKYNQWRSLQETLTLRDKLQIQDDSLGGDRTDLGLLDIPGAGGTQMARSISGTSSRSTEGNHGGNGARPKACRQGPLGEYERLRTGFTRTLKACPDCRTRRVRVGCRSPLALPRRLRTAS
jgi:hypothetical protein